MGTVVLIARLCPDGAAREANLVRFVTLLKPLRALFGLAVPTNDRFDQADALRDRISALPLGHGESDDLDWSVLRQEELLRAGTS